MKNCRFVLTLSCQDRVGIVAKVAQYLAKVEGFILESSQFSDLRSSRFFMRTLFEYHGTPLSPAQFTDLFTPIASELNLDWKLHDLSHKPRLLLLVSTQSHCLNDLLHRMRSGSLPVEVPAVVSNHRDLEEIAAWHKIPFHYLPVTSDTKEAQENQILKLVDALNIDLVVLARYMQILSTSMTHRLAGRAINIHHSFLPSFKGAKPYHQAFDRGVKLIGATAHYVSDQLDEGPIIEQEILRVDHAHTPEQLVELGKDIEAQVLARAVKFHIEHRVFLNGHKTIIFK
jgi:formyltetrahydrofolate deformylase